jgi:hypothetical protein
MIDSLSTERCIEAAQHAYVVCALWSSTGQYCQVAGGWICQNEAHVKEDWPLDEHFTADDIAPDTLEAMHADVADFLESCWADDIDLGALEPEQIGHDLWLTRNHHGAGFRDRGLGELGGELTKRAHAYGGVGLYVGDDGQVHA